MGINSRAALTFATLVSFINLEREKKEPKRSSAFPPAFRNRMSRIRTEPVASCFPISLTEKWDKFPEKTLAEVLDPACESITQLLPSGKRHSSPVIALEDEGGLASKYTDCKTCISSHWHCRVLPPLNVLLLFCIPRHTIASMEWNPSNGLQGFLMRLRMFVGVVQWMS